MIKKEKVVLIVILGSLIVGILFVLIIKHLFKYTIVEIIDYVTVTNYVTIYSASIAFVSSIAILVKFRSIILKRNKKILALIFGWFGILSSFAIFLNTINKYHLNYIYFISFVGITVLLLWKLYDRDN